MYITKSFAYNLQLCIFLNFVLLKFCCVLFLGRHNLAKKIAKRTHYYVRLPYTPLPQFILVYGFFFFYISVVFVLKKYDFKMFTFSNISVLELKKLVSGIISYQASVGDLRELGALQYSSDLVYRKVAANCTLPVM